MKCETVREALSARIDGEDELISVDITDRHLSVCPACDDWYQRAEALHHAMILHTTPWPRTAPAPSWRSCHRAMSERPSASWSSLGPRSPRPSCSQPSDTRRTRT
ncbi:zf-HC2 domain-containing protein [Nocardia sp. NBC_01329]|uniref:zf-HC2 domain-containing protein n=1 Tax=Nocardia sp. NBC_01329 TaxID=2903594 RepID=UPI003FA35D0A